MYRANTVASPRNDRKPKTSVSVVMNTDEASAGSTFAARSPSGTSVPAVAATNMLMIIAAHSTSPSTGLPREIQRSEEHTSELQSQSNIVCRLLLESSGTHHDLHSFPTRRSSDLDRKPKTSVSVVMNTDEASAGSTFAARSPSGTSVPAVAATNMLMIIAAHSTSPSTGLPREIQ